MREIYETAIEEEPPNELPDADVRSMGLRYAQLERKLGEIDRARAIFVHVSSLCDPRRDKAFWAEWKQFEVAHGNEDTFREMLRIQRCGVFGVSAMPGARDALLWLPAISPSTSFPTYNAQLGFTSHTHLDTQPAVLAQQALCTHMHKHANTKGNRV